MRWKYRRIARGMTFGTLFGMLWLLIPFQDNNLNGTPLILSVIFLVLLIMGCIGLFHIAASMPKESKESAILDKTERSRTRKMFGLVFSAEFVLIGLGASILISKGLNDLVVPIIAIIVGVHFFPLARLFKAHVYNITGAAAVFAGLASFPVNTEPARQNFVGFSMGIILWLTAAYTFIHVRREMTDVKSNT
jgi:archaellum biogenesis protein FlaJ (TadC family)